MSQSPIESFCSRFFAQHKHLFEHKQCLVINPEKVFQPLDDIFHQVHFACLREDQKDARAQNQTIVELLNTQLPENCDVIFILPKAKKLTQIILHWLAVQNLSSNPLWVIGENDLGAKSFAKLGQKYNLTSQQLDNARRCRAFEVYSTQAYLKAFNLNDHLQNFEYLEHQLTSLPGVFSHGHIDKGTLVLLEYLKNSSLNIQGKILDFACGCGIIAQFCTRYSEQIDAIDTDYFSIFCANQSNELNNTQINFVAQNGLQTASTKYNWIISNPPFHENKRTNYSITELFISQSKQHLCTNGSLLLVVNDFLDYESKIKQSFTKIEILHNQRGFKVILAQN